MIQWTLSALQINIIPQQKHENSPGKTSVQLGIDVVCPKYVRDFVKYAAMQIYVCACAKTRVLKLEPRSFGRTNCCEIAGWKTRSFIKLIY